MDSSGSRRPLLRGVGRGTTERGTAALLVSAMKEAHDCIVSRQPVAVGLVMVCDRVWALPPSGGRRSG